MLTEAEFEELVAQRAEIERLRGDVRVARNELALERESYEQMHDVAIRHRQDSDKWAALAADATARAEKAEAERYEALAKLSAAYHTAEVRYGERVAADARLDSERARADRYLAAMQDAVRAYDRLAKGGYGGDLAVAWATLRALVEEDRRG